MRELQKLNILKPGARTRHRNYLPRPDLTMAPPASTSPAAKAAHVNMMTDTIIANLPPDGLRSVLRGLLGVDPKVTPAFQTLATNYLESTRPTSIPELFDYDTHKVLLEFFEFQGRYRCMMGCGLVFESLESIREVVKQVRKLDLLFHGIEDEGTERTLAAIDGDIVQAITALQKAVTADHELMKSDEAAVVHQLLLDIYDCGKYFISSRETPPFQRGDYALTSFMRHDRPEAGAKEHVLERYQYKPSSSKIETTTLGKATVPRMFMGLWQFSSPAWGSASFSDIQKDFRKHVDAGLVAFDMADHYGDAEQTFVSLFLQAFKSCAELAYFDQGQFRSSQKDSSGIFCATKWCVFEHITVSPEVVDAAITERLNALQVNGIELLQFHWQDYNDKQYIEAAKLIFEDSRIDNLGLCNFDTEHMNEIIDGGVKVVSNQVQFSLIDLRPTFRMAESCRKHDVKLLTYGSLCGGLLADRWLGKPAPNLFDPDMTPSSRKYFEMIAIWGGWTLFQELLTTLSAIGQKYDVSISVIAVKWVLQHNYVGAVIVGARMGISEHVEENLKTFGFELDVEDLLEIKKVLDKCRAREVFESMGDCGAEYR